MKILKYLMYSLIIFITSFSYEYLNGRVERVTDGDTFVMEVDGENVEIKLWGVEAPERKQYYGIEAKLNLITLIKGKELKVKILDRTEDLIIGEAFLEGRENLAERLLSDGFLWWDRKVKNSRYEFFEKNARFRRVGLWENEYAVPPWDFRRGVPEKRELIKN